LIDVPDPRRIDLRATLRSTRREWLVRTHRQRAATPLHAIVDVSASMNFGVHRRKLEWAADLVESMGDSAFRAGDPAGLVIFGAAGGGEFMPARRGRGIGRAMGDSLRQRVNDSRADPPGSLQRATDRLAGREGLVFLVSDFHWPLEELAAALDRLHRARLVPVVVWDRAELEPPPEDGLLEVRDAETNGFRALWVDRALRARWLDRVGERRAALDSVCAARGVRPFYLIDCFDPDALSRYFLEGYA
jgi:uncharacterized protein (DUF58 family)